jgi:hypothetical protein
MINRVKIYFLSMLFHTILSTLNFTYIDPSTKITGCNPSKNRANDKWNVRTRLCCIILFVYIEKIDDIQQLCYMWSELQLRLENNIYYKTCDLVWHRRRNFSSFLDWTGSRFSVPWLYYLGWNLTQWKSSLVASSALID